MQTNRLLRPGPLHYKHAIGVKTGYHRRAKSTLIAAAECNGRRLVAVLLGNKDRTRMYKDAASFFETAYNQPKVKRTFLAKGEQKFSLKLKHAASSITTSLQSDLFFEYFPSEDPEMSCLMKWDPVSLPIVKGQRVGEVYLQASSGALLASVPLIANNDVDWIWYARLLKRTKSLFESPPYIGWVMLFGPLLALYYYYRRNSFPK